MRPFNEKENNHRPRGPFLGCWCWDKLQKTRGYSSFLYVCVKQTNLCSSTSSGRQDVKIWAQRTPTWMRPDRFSVGWISGLSADCLERHSQGEKIKHCKRTLLQDGKGKKRKKINSWELPSAVGWRVEKVVCGHGVCKPAGPPGVTVRCTYSLISHYFSSFCCQQILIKKITLLKKWSVFLTFIDIATPEQLNHTASPLEFLWRVYYFSVIYYLLIL